MRIRQTGQRLDLLTSKSRSRARTLHAMRASLLASAIARTLRCNRFLAPSIQRLSPWRSHRFGFIQHDPCGLNEQNSKVAITTLRYLAQDGAVPGRDLLGNEAKPCGKVSSFGEAIASPDRRDHGAGDDRSDARDAHQPFAPGVLPRKGGRSRRISCSIRSSSRRQSSAKPSMMRTMRGDSTSGGVARIRGSSARKNRYPCRTATPRSRRKARI